MGPFDNLEAKAGEIAKSTGLALGDVHPIATTFQANLTSSDGNAEAAIEAAAAQHGEDTATPIACPMVAVRVPDRQVWAVGFSDTRPTRRKIRS